MGATSVKGNKQKEGDIEKENNKENKDESKSIEIRKRYSFQPITQPKDNPLNNKAQNNNNYNLNNYNNNYSNNINNYKAPIKEIDRADSAPINYTYHNLELTDYFDNIFDKDKEDFDKIYYKYTHSFFNFNNNNNSNEESELKSIREKINSDFGLMKSMQNDFDKMKTCLLYCPSLSMDDENFIDKLEFYDFLINNMNHKESILNVINKNQKDVREYMAKVK